MYEKKNKKNADCPLEYSMEMFGGKWKSRIICVIHKGTRVRYSEFKKCLPDISDPVLSSLLKKLIEDDIVEKEVFHEVPMRTEYFLTQKGRSIVPILLDICCWANTYAVNESVLWNCKKCDR